MSLHRFTDSGSAVSYLDVSQLIETLIADIRHLECEVVRTRYELSRYLTEKEREMLSSDILSNLGGRHAGNPAYDVFVRRRCNGIAPMDSDQWVEHIWRLAHSEESDLW